MGLARTGACLLAAVALSAGLAACRHVAEPRARATKDERRTISVAGPSVPSGKVSCRLTRRRYHTLPNLRPTGFCLVRRRGSALAAEDILVTPRPDSDKNPGEQFGLMILSNAGKLLWYERRPDKVHDLKVLSYRGRPALAFFQTRSSGRNYYQLLDQHYRPIARVRAAHGYPTNLHELKVTPSGTAYISANVTVNRPGAGKVVEYVVQELDIATGTLLFEWRSLAHTSLGDSYEARPRHGPWDYFHGNSVDPPTSTDPTLIISSRNTSSLYGVDRSTGRTEWILGGKRDQFHLSRHPSWGFCGQHDAHRLPNGDVMLLDNGGTYMHGRPRCPVHPARVLVFRIDERRKRVRLVRSISSVPLSRDGSGFFSGWVGGAALESNGDTLVDWGGPTNRVTEVAPDGRLDLLLRLQYWSYRATPAFWTGLPAGSPTVRAVRDGGLARLWASWNGATEIRGWQALAGRSPDSLAPTGRPFPFADLETRILLRSGAPYVAVRALDARGAALGQSAAVRVG